MDRKISIAIDGPAAAGKSTVAKIVASKLSYIYIDTGAMYRTLTYKALQNGVDPEDEQALYHLLQKTTISLETTDSGQIVRLDGIDVTSEIRTPNVTAQVSAVSQHKLVREEMVFRQQTMGSLGGVVMDGRDIGTHVLPEAEVKIFLLASVEERAKRRHDENLSKGFQSDIIELQQQIAARDKFDSEREISPLEKAEDAFAIDTTSMSINDVVELIMDKVAERS